MVLPVLLRGVGGGTQGAELRARPTGTTGSEAGAAGRDPTGKDPRETDPMGRDPIGKGIR